MGVPPLFSADLIMTINIDFSKDSLFDELGLRRLKDSYMMDSETSPQERFAYVAEKFGSNPEHSQRLYEYLSNHWLSASTPILSYGRSKRGLPISCLTDNNKVTVAGEGDKSPSQIKVGDLLRTHQNRWRKVVAIKESLSSDIWHVKLRSVPNITEITGNHLVYTMRGWIAVEALDQKSDLVGYLSPHGISFDYIQVLKSVPSPEVKVWDFQVEEDESFVVNGMVVHNCYLSYNEDTTEGLINTLSEVNWLSVLGGGVGVHLGIRSRDDKSTGIIPHLKVYDSSSMAYRQGRTRRGSYAVYLDISHPDIKQFIEIRKTMGDPNLRCQNLHHGVNLSDAFMSIIERCTLDPTADDSWPLIDPHSKEVKEVVSAKALWQDLLSIRNKEGEPYFVFLDTANKALPQHLAEKGLRINGSNLCSEIFLPTDKDRTAVCCLSSLNLNYYKDWKDNYQFHKDVLEFLDNALEVFIQTAPDTISRAKYSAQMERSVGVGVLGFHTHLQNLGIGFESALAKSENLRIFKGIRENLDKANLELGTERGEAPDAKGTGKRCSHVMAVAPTATTSIIMGNISPSIEPIRANVYRQDTLSGSHVNVNPAFRNWLNSQDFSEEEKKAILHDVLIHEGSVQHLPTKVMSELWKFVFRTATEIDQRWVVELAGDRQKFIDQGQSVNLFFPAKAHVAYLHAVHLMAWKKGLKSLYYYRSERVKKGEAVSVKVDLKAIVEDTECLACQ